MKKNIRAVMVIAAIALVGGVNIYNAQKTVDMSDVALANVEALADGEDASWVMECVSHGCIIDFSWDCFFSGGIMWGYCPNMRSA
jgi:hypothetical protein